MNRKGFTLIELLVTIAIVALVVGISTYGIITSINNSKEKALALTSNNIKDAARLYATEQNSDEEWKEVADYDYKYFCVTIQELINKGLLSSKDTLKKDYGFTSSTYVIVMKDKMTSVVEKEEITDDSSLDSYKICTGEIKNEEVTAPEIEGSTSYTDEIDLKFIDGVAESSKEYECLYGLNSNNLDKKGRIEGNVCMMEDLKNNTNYYARICMTTERNSYICTKTEAYKTKEFTLPEIVKEGRNGVIINYDDTNIRVNPGYYFKSSVDTMSIGDVFKCELDDNNVFSCSSKAVTTVEKDTWYKTELKSVNLQYPDQNFTVKVTTRIADDSNNYKESSKDILIQKNLVTYTATFYLGLADTINGGKKNITISCDAEEGGSCTASTKAPTISRSGYTVVGWNTSQTATNAKLNSGDRIVLTGNIAYYPITYKKITVTFNKNGALSVGKTTDSCNVYNNETSCKITAPQITGPSSTPTVIGWNTNKSAKTSTWDVNDSKSFSSNTTYYAITKGSSKTYTATFKIQDVNAATTSSGSKSCTIPETYNGNTQSSSCNITAPTLTAKTGYNVVGWNSNSSATSASVGSGASLNISGNITYYSITKKPSKTYTATFKIQDANTATTSSGSKSCTIAEAYNGNTQSSSCNITAPTLTAKTGYIAVGWNTNSSATSANVGSGASVNLTSNVTYYSIVKNAAPPPSLTISISSHGFKQTYSNSNGGTKRVNITCNSSSCTDIGTNSCTTSSCQGIGWSGKKPIVSWSTNSLNTLRVYYDNKTHSQFDESNWGTYSKETNGTMSVETGGHRIIRIDDTDGISTLEVRIYFKLDYVAPIVNLPSSSITAWRKDLWDINYSDNESGLNRSVNAFAEPTYISCSDSQAKNNCGITNGAQSYSGNTGTKTTQCSEYYDCYSNYLELWSCATDNVGNKTCSKRVNPSGSQVNYTYLVKDD